MDLQRRRGLGRMKTFKSARGESLRSRGRYPCEAASAGATIRAGQAASHMGGAAMAACSKELAPLPWGEEARPPLRDDMLLDLIWGGAPVHEKQLMAFSAGNDDSPAGFHLAPLWPSQLMP